MYILRWIKFGHKKQLRQLFLIKEEPFIWKNKNKDGSTYYKNTTLHLRKKN
jgi:hypothetical protein